MIFSSKVMNLNFKDSVGYLTFKELEKYNFVNHAFSTRIGGVSKQEFKSMNLGLLSKDKKENITENYKIFCQALNFDVNKLVRGYQIHSNTIKNISEKHINTKDSVNRFFESTDGFITNIPGIVLVTLHADCPSVFMLDPIKKVVGLAHAGWRGTVAKIAENLVTAFIYNYGSSPKDIVCAVGPGIGKCCFEVSDSILPEFEKLNIKNYYYFEKSSNKMYVDLLEVNKQILINTGIDINHIFVSDICTACNHELLFSHRVTKGKRGNNAAFISIK